MKRQRALWVIGALVLAVHWLVLAGLPAHSSAPSPHAQAPAFATRTLAAPAPAIAPPQATPPVRPARPPAKAQSPVRKKPPTPAAAAAPQPIDPTSAAAPAPDAAALENIDTEAALLAAQPAHDPEAPPEASAQAAAEGAHSPPDATATPTPPATPALAGAIDITPPGSSAAAQTSSAAPAVRIPPPMRLEFDVTGQAKKFNYSARAQLLWQHDGHHYQAQQEISMLFLGSRSQTSVGTLGPTGLLPQRFGDRARSEQAAHFDYAQGRVTFSANTPDAPMATGTQDRLSVFFQLGALLAAAPERYPAGTRISVATVSARAADVWSFTVQPQETLDLPVGALAAIPLERLPRREHDQTAQVWLAPALGYLPVRIRIVQANGDFADLRLRSHAAP